MAYSADLSTVTAGAVKWGFGFHQPFQHKISILLQKHPATAVKRVCTLKGQVSQNFFPYLHLVWLFITPQSACDTLISEDIIDLCHWWRWSGWTRSLVTFVAFFFTVEWEPATHEHKLNMGHQPERRFRAHLLPIPFIFSVFPHDM